METWPEFHRTDDHLRDLGLSRQDLDAFEGRELAEVQDEVDQRGMQLRVVAGEGSLDWLEHDSHPRRVNVDVREGRIARVVGVG